MRATPALRERITPHRRQWAGLGDRLQRSFTAAKPTTTLTEHPAAPLGQTTPSFRRFKPTSHFSIFKLNELQRTVDNAAAYKLVFFAPVSALRAVKDAVFATGAGTMHRGLYSRCCFQTMGTSQFRPEIGAMASSARNLGRVEVVEEVKVEIVCHGKAQARDAVRALLHEHPHDAPIYEVIKLEYGFLPSQVSLDRTMKKTEPIPRMVGGERTAPPSETLATRVQHRISDQFYHARASKGRVSYRLTMSPPRETPSEEAEQNIPQMQGTTAAETAGESTGGHGSSWLERAKQASSQVRGMHTKSNPPMDQVTPPRQLDTPGQREFNEGLDDLMTRMDTSVVLGGQRAMEEPVAATPQPPAAPTMTNFDPSTADEQAAPPPIFLRGPIIEPAEEFYARLTAAHPVRSEPKTMRELLEKLIARLELAKPATDAPPAKKQRHYYKRKRAN
ncbi:hypothetical protein Dda_1242 [Drechslerella dactyloides]|uniref:ATP phosphoribosyltransferase n=1 Tax=Drechslerella dactyloides TaxID=74499 RepID=A0AAD6J235_DREDA|nr:hypothetical protein Dda_1242 [Drechslerella dactyloides]